MHRPSLLKTVLILQSLAACLLLSSCAEMALNRELQQLEASRQAGTISKSKYTARKSQIQKQLKVLDQQYWALNAQFHQPITGDVPQVQNQPPTNGGTGILSTGRSDADTFSYGAAPSEAFARQVIAGKISSESGGAFQLISFQKTNGISSSSSGVSYYTMEGVLTFRATTALTWTGGPDQLLGGSIRFTVGPPPPNASINTQLLMFAHTQRSIQAGQTLSSNVAMRFQKTERGWRCTSLEAR